MTDFRAIPIVKIGGCSLYRPGHLANCVQARVCWTEDRVREVELVQIGTDSIVVRSEDQILRLLNHNLDDVRNVVRDRYESIHMTLDGTLLTLGIHGGYISFSVKADAGEPLEPCPLMQGPAGT